MLRRLLLLLAVCAPTFVAAQGGTIGGSGSGGNTNPQTVTPKDSIRFTGTTNAIVGGAGNMTILAGTGNSRKLIAQSSNSSGTATTFLTGAGDTTKLAGRLFFTGSATINFNGSAGTIFSVNQLRAPSTPNAVDLFTNGGSMILHATAGAVTPQIQSSNSGSAANPAFTFTLDSTSGVYNVSSGATDTVAVATNGLATLRVTGGSTATLVGGAGSMTILAGTGNARSLTLRSSNSTGTATTFAVGSGDTLKLSGHLIATGLSTEGSTQSAVCVTNGGGEVFINAAATCTVSSRRFKENIVTLNDSVALAEILELRPVTYNEKNGSRVRHIGLVAEEVDSVDHRLVTRDPQGRVNSVNYEQVTVLLLSAVKQQQRDITLLRDTLLGIVGAAGVAGAGLVAKKKVAVAATVS